ncbi:MAG: sel1 repeat family protein [Muribaculaceae bacterium]|nr:sel1 repeat family protein [Muribaculaceae bacterium]
MRKLLLILPLLIAGLLMSAYRSPDEAGDTVRDLKARADSGHPEAMYRLALLYENGYDSVPRDSVKFMQLLTGAAEEAWLPAQNYLGYLLLRQGRGSEGLHWLENAAIAGDAKAQSNLGFLLLDDGGPSSGDPATNLRRGIVADNEKAAFWLERAAQSGVATASSMLGDLYRDGRGVPQDSLLAAACYYAAIDAGLADAAYKLEAMERRKWEALSPEKQLQLGLYLYTHRVPDLAIPIFSRLTDLPASDPGPVTSATTIRGAAFALLGDAYTRALGVGYAHDLSLEYYWRAAELGNAPAQFVISELLEIFPDALDLLSDNPPGPQQLREAAAQAGIHNAEEATRRLMNPIYDE